MSLEKTTAFVSRHFGPPRVALAVAAWILALGVWGTFARSVLPMEHRLEWEIPVELRAPLYAKFDSGWYLSIIEWGYGPPPPAGNPSTHSFFPLYPWTAKVLHHTFAMDGFHAGMLVTYVCLFLAVPLFRKEGIRRLGEAGAARSLLFLLLFPTAFFLASMYSESMFFLFALLAFRDAREGRTRRAVLWGILLGLTRPSAIAVAPALFVAALEARSKVAALKPRSKEVALEPRSRDAALEQRPGVEATVPQSIRFRDALLIGAAPFCAVWAWILGDGLAHGEAGLFFRSMAGWHRGASSLSGAAAWFQKLAAFVSGAGWKTEPMLLFDYGAALLCVLITIRFAVRRRWADAVWSAAALALPLSTGLSSGMPRYLYSVYPAMYELADFFSGRPRARIVWWVVSGGLLLFAAARFVNALGVA